VIRGGGWGSGGPENVSAADRGWSAPGDRDGLLGFRCARTAEPKLEEGKVARVVAKPGASVGEMVRFAGGTYAMGETKRTVTVAPFLLDVTEVTAGAYAACVTAG
jgi:formylglycine-generating enzyme required for sulfatase activity